MAEQPRERRRPASPTGVRVEAVEIIRGEGFGLLLRVWPHGPWRLREYDANGDEVWRGRG